MGRLSGACARSFSRPSASSSWGSWSCPGCFRAAGGDGEERVPVKLTPRAAGGTTPPPPGGAPYLPAAVAVAAAAAAGRRAAMAVTLRSRGRRVTPGLTPHPHAPRRKTGGSAGHWQGPTPPSASPRISSPGVIYLRFVSCPRVNFRGVVMLGVSQVACPMGLLRRHGCGQKLGGLAQDQRGPQTRFGPPCTRKLPARSQERTCTCTETGLQGGERRCDPRASRAQVYLQAGEGRPCPPRQLPAPPDQGSVSSALTHCLAPVGPANPLWDQEGDSDLLCPPFILPSVGAT